MKSTINNAMKRIKILSLVLMVLILTIISATLTLSESLPQKLLYLSVEKPYYELGEKVTLIITTEPLTDYELSVLSSENLYKYSGEIKNNIDFYPKEEGLHRVELVNKLTKAVVDSLEFYVGKPAAENNNGEIINGTNETNGVNGTNNETQLTNQTSQTSQTNQGNQSNATEITNSGLTRLILTDKQIYAIGETVIATVSMPLNEQQNYKLYYEYEGFTQRYMGDFTYITFVPQGLGTHHLILRDKSDSEVERASFEVVEKIVQENETSINETNETQTTQTNVTNNLTEHNLTNGTRISAEETSSATLENISEDNSAIMIEQRDLQKILKTKNKLGEKEGVELKILKKSRVLNKLSMTDNLTINNLTINLSDINSRFYGFYDLEIKPQNKALKKIMLNNLWVEDETADITFALDDVLPEKILSDNAEARRNIGNNRILKAFSIDTSSLNFTNGTATAVAEGRELWKCKNWSFDNQACLGSWEKVMDIIPGFEYSIPIAPNDPAYAETGVATVNTNKPIYHPDETATIFMVVLDTQGHLVEGAAITLTIISPSNTTTTLTTAARAGTGQVIEISRGVYKAEFSDTTEEGDYELIVNALALGVNSTMQSNFRVSAQYDFDIIRSSPLTTDPFKGPFFSSIRINPLVSVDNEVYNFTEVLPLEFEVVSAPGAIQSSDQNHKYLNWQDLTGDSVVEYSAQPPKVTPNLFALGKAFVNYVIQGVVKVFEEVRNWLLAIDPEVPTDDGLIVYFTRWADASFGYLKYRNWTSDMLSNEVVSNAYFGYERVAWTKFKCLSTMPLCIDLSSMRTLGNLSYTIFNTSNWQWTNPVPIARDNQDLRWSWDIECEDLTKRCLIAYENRTVNDNYFQYRTWNGTTMSGPYGYNITVMDNWTINWIKLYPKKNSNIIGIMVQNQGNASGGQYIDNGTASIVGGIWNGTNFTNWKVFTFNAPRNSTTGDSYVHQRHFDCGWEGGTDKLLCVYANDTNRNILAYRFNGTGWEDLGSIYGNMTEPWEFTVCGQEPTSTFNHSYLGIMTCDNESDLDGGIWNGTAFSKTLGSQAPAKNTNAECGRNKAQGQWGQNFQCKWENSGDQAVFVWVNTASDSFLTSGTYTKSTNTFSNSNWYSGTKIIAGGTAELRTANLVQNPYNDKIFLTYTDVGGGYRHGGCSLWRGNVWDGAGCNNSASFEVNGTTDARLWISFDWFRQRLEPYIVINKPSLTYSNYNYNGSSQGGQAAAAYNGATNQNPPSGVSAPIAGNEFDALCYQSTAALDDDFWCTSLHNNGSAGFRAYQSYKFYVTDPAISISEITLQHEGYALKNATPDDFRIFVYNWNTDTYELKKTVFGGTGGDVYSETLITGTMTNYVSNNTVYILIEGLTNSTTTTNLGVNTNYINLLVKNKPVLRASQTYNASVIDADGVSGCRWAYFNASGQVNALTEMSSISGYYINTTGTTSVPDNTYSIYVFCNDSLSNTRNASIIVRIDNTLPNILLVSPNTSANITVSYVAFSWNVTDITLENMACNITLDGTIRSPTNIVSPDNQVTSQNISSISDGTHYWNVSCVDNAGNQNTSETRSSDIDTAGPSISLNYPEPGSYKNDQPINLNFTATDAHAIVNCSLYLDSIYNNSLYNLTSSQMYNFTFNNLNQGFHWWNISCFDNFNYKTNSSTYNFTYDITKPNIVLNTSEVLFNGTMPQLNYTVTDNIDGNLTCNITVNGEIVDYNISSQNNTLINRNITLVSGYKTWTVTCWDDAGNTNTSKTGYFQVIGGPLIKIYNPANDTVGNGSNITFNYNVTDGYTVLNCSLYLDGVLNQTNSSIPDATYGVNTSFYIEDLAEGLHLWNITCFNSILLIGSSDIYRLTSDRTKPNIILVSPEPEQIVNSTPVRFNFTLIDALSPNATCNLTVDGNISAANMNFKAINISVTSRNQTLGNGIHYWNVTCMDLGNNINTSVTQNFTVNVTFPINVTVLANKIIYQENEVARINVTTRNDSKALIPANITLDYIYTNNTYTDVPWWNLSFPKRRPIFINETLGQNRVEKPVLLNLTFLLDENVRGCYNLRIINDNTLMAVAYNLISGDGVYTCNIIFNATVSASAVNENNYHLYFGNSSIDDPGYPNLLQGNNLLYDTFSSVINSSNWITATWNWSSNNPPQLGSGGNAHINGSVINATIRLTNIFNLAKYDIVNISFIWAIGTNWSTGSGDFLRLDYTNTSRTNWSAEPGAASLDAGINNGTRYNFSTTLNSSYKVDGFSLRFRATANNTGRHGGFDTFNMTAYNIIATNISAKTGINQIFVERVINATNASGFYNTSWNTSGRNMGNYSTVVYATTADPKLRPGTGYDWFTIIRDTYGPNITLIWPYNNMTNHTGSYTFSYNASDVANYVSNCSLILNNSVNQVNTSINQTSPNYFTVTGMGEGRYNWSVLCYDSIGNSANSSTWYFYLDDSAPNVLALSPNVTPILPSGNITFRFNVTDNLANKLLCNITMDNRTNNKTVNATNGTTTNATISNITDGIHYWNVTCYDNIYNNATSLTLNFTTASLPIVTLDSPPNGYGVNSTGIVLYYNLSSSIIVNCSLILNGSIYDTDNESEIPYKNNDGKNNFTLTGLNYGVYNWTIICFDQNNFNDTDPTRTFQLDNLAPNITLLFPGFNQTLTTKNINFVFNVTDIDPVLMCNLTIDGVVNKTNISANSSANTTVPVNGLTLTNHNWSVTCVDNTSFSTTSDTWPFNLNSSVSVSLASPGINATDQDGDVNFTYTPNSGADFTTGQCKLYFDGSVQDTHTTGLHSGVSDTFVETGLPEGSHTWYVNCTDNNGVAGWSETRNILIDKINPVVVAYYPNGDSFNTSTVFFNWSVTDNLDSNLTCNVTVNGTIKTPAKVGSTNGTVTNATYGGFNDGLLLWNVTCNDDVGRTNTSATLNFTVNEPPKVGLGNPPNNNRTRNQTIIFYYTPTDNSGNISSCTIILDGLANETNNTLTNSGIQRSTTVSGITEWLHNWTVNCTDPSGNIGINNSIKNFTVDMSAPNITLFLPNEGDYLSANVLFNWTAVDYNNTNIRCDLYIDSNYNKTATQVSGSFFNTTVYNMTDGPHNWSVNCTDDVGNWEMSETRNFTINQPDLYLDNSRISFNNTNPDLYQSIQIRANVSNIGGVPANNVFVEFWDNGMPGTGTYLGNATASVAINASVLFNTTWSITPGYHTIYALADPYNAMPEMNETNNNATANISVLFSNITYPDNNTLTTNNTLLINFNVTDYTANNITYKIFVDGSFNGQTNNVTAGSNTSLTLSTLGDGNHLIKVQATDTLGRGKNSSSINITVDTLPPTVNFETRNGSWFNYSTPAISFNITDLVDTNINYTIYVNGSFEQASNATRNTSTSVNLGSRNDGRYNVTIQATDDVNHSANYSIIIYIDTTKPGITLNYPGNTANFTNTSVRLNFTATDNLDPSLTCNLTLDGVVNRSNFEANNTQETSTLINGLTEAIHYWNVTCWDNASNTNTSETRSFNVFIAPRVNLTAPPNGNVSNNPDQIFYFNVSDDTGILNCSLLFYGAVNMTKPGSEITNNANNNFTVNGLNGRYNWSVVCYDNSTQQRPGYSENWTITVDLDAPYPNITTANYSWFNSSSPRISFIITDSFDLSINYTFFVNNTANISNATGNNTPTNASLQNLNSNSSFMIVLQATDDAGNSRNSSSIIIFVDTVKPSINLSYPTPGLEINDTTVQFNFTVTDNMANYTICNLTISNGMNETNINATNNTLINITKNSFTSGTFYWNVSCIDLATNRNTSVTWNFTIRAPDLTITSGNITFNDSSFEEGRNITIYANIYNIGGSPASNVKVQFWRGDPSSGGTQVDGNQTIAVLNNGNNYTFNITYPPVIGNNNIFVVVDPPTATNGTIAEANESNNKANNSFSVSFYQVYAGNTTELIDMEKQSINRSIYIWDVSNATGSNIFVTDIEANPDFNNLQAIGINTTNQTASNDFVEIDTKLGSTNYSDSINTTFTSNGVPKANKTYIIFTKTINTVPIINSTNTSNFQTGMLWDKGDGGIEYNGTQDLIFITEINKNQQGSQGTYDFEIKVPALLRNYDAAGTSIAFYAELK
jgi:hypothetical protein